MPWLVVTIPIPIDNVSGWNVLDCPWDCCKSNTGLYSSKYKKILFSIFLGINLLIFFPFSKFNKNDCQSSLVVKYLATKTKIFLYIHKEEENFFPSFMFAKKKLVFIEKVWKGNSLSFTIFFHHKVNFYWCKPRILNCFFLTIISLRSQTNKNLNQSLLYELQGYTTS